MTWKPGGLKRWSNQIVDVDLDRLEIGRRRARMQVMFIARMAILDLHGSDD